MGRYDSAEVEIELPALFARPLAAVLKEYGYDDEAANLLRSTGKFGSSTHRLDAATWDTDLLKAAIAVLENQGVTPPRGIISLLKGLGRIRLNPVHTKIAKLQLLPQAIARYLAHEAIDGWIYKLSPEDTHIAYVVERTWYTPESREHRAYVGVMLRANRAGYDEERDRSNNDVFEETITFQHDDIVKGSVEQIILGHGYLKETPELKAAYLKEMELFEKYLPQQNAQFLCHKKARTTDHSYWRTDDLYKLVHPTKMVQDEGLLERSLTLDCDNSFWRIYEGVEDKFKTIPIQPYLLFYDLSKHTNCWVHVINCEEYVYDPTLREKLVLPETHRELIDVLTTDMDVFVDDIIKGKSGGTAILCYGEPGLGKTLTAEVYSELVERPLYRIHAGQLGTTIDTVEDMLETCLKRAERWGAVMLIDEADVYIRKRSNDMAHNAVVAAFLKTLEYFNGLLFMTTNRVSDVDDAIASRMVAMFKYETPDEVQAKKIWKVLSTQFKIKLTKEFIGELYEEFPKCSGRDIKQLLKLTMKYCKQKQRPMDIAAFNVCAMFRGIR